MHDPWETAPHEARAHHVDGEGLRPRPDHGRRQGSGAGAQPSGGGARPRPQRTGGRRALDRWRSATSPTLTPRPRRSQPRTSVGSPRSRRDAHPRPVRIRIRTRSSSPRAAGSTRHRRTSADDALGPLPSKGGRPMPEGATKKQKRQYEHIKESYQERGVSADEAKERAARTVNKQRGKSKSKKKG